MKLQCLVTVTAVAIFFVGGQPLSAQQMSPYGAPQMSPYGMPGVYQPVAPMGYPAAYPPTGPPEYDVRQEALDGPGLPGSECNGCGQPGCTQCACSSDCWNHCVAVFGELLYLRARNAEVAYGFPREQDDAPPMGRLGVVDQDYNPGFRFGASYVLDGCSSVTTQFTYFETGRTDQLAANAIGPLVLYENAQNFGFAEARHDIEFEFLDVDYRRVLACADDHNLAFLVGVRAGQFRQEFSADFFSGAIGTDSVQTEIDFYGAGLRLGLEGERYSNSRRWLVYGKTYANFVAGDFTADYREQLNGVPVVDTTWKAGRIVPMLDLEVGAGWQSRCGTWRITGGYLISSWYNTVKTDEWIGAVQSNNYVGLSGNTSFDGLVVRCEGRF